VPKQKLDYTVETTLQPQHAAFLPAGAEPGKFAFQSPDWTALELDLYSSLDVALGARENLDVNLAAWTSLYELEVDADGDVPWENAAQLNVPIIPAEVDAMLAYVVLTVFTPRLFLFNGHTKEAAQHAPLVERYYNAWLNQEQDDGKTPYEQCLTVIHLALRDGLGGMETLWRHRIRNRPIVTFQPKTDDNGEFILDDGGNPEVERVITQAQEKINEVAVTPILLKDVLFLPAESTSSESAAAVMRAEWLYESDCQEMIKAGIFDPDAVEFCLNFVPTGQSDVSSDRQGYYDKNLGGQIDVGLAQGTLVSRFFKNRGPLKVWRIHSRQYDLNEDGIVEENIFWVHETSQRMLGWMPYEYISGKRPFHFYAPFPRPDRIEGYSLIERLADIVAEINANKNQRLNYQDLLVGPPLLENAGDEVRNKGKAWGPLVKWVVQDVNNSYKVMQLPPVPTASFQEDAQNHQYIAKLTGQNAPSLGAQGPGKRSATENKIQATAQTTRTNLIALFFRFFLRKVLHFIHTLNLQYLEDDPQFTQDNQRLTVPREILALDYAKDVAGISNPIDSATRRSDAMALMAVMQNFPNIMSNPKRLYALQRLLLETFELPDIESIIGTEQEADAAAQQAAQQAAQMQQAQVVAQATGQAPEGQGQ
jgi:hypothetical protein